MKKIGIYNPHIKTMGGGEKVAVAMAESLSRDNSVMLIVRDKINKKKFEKYFNVNLGRVEIVVLPKGGKTARLLGSPLLPLPGRAREIIASSNDYRQLKQLKLDLFINSYYQSNCKSVAKLGIYMCMFPQKIHSINKERGFVVRIYHLFMSLLERMFGLGREFAIDSYDVILANSEYTKKWIKKLWGKDADILYPICDDMGPPAKKEKIILNVGRFFAGTEDNHHKCQDVLLEQFKKIKGLHSDGWQLHFVGSTADDPDSLRYIIKLIEDAEGFPVHFHLNASHSELRELYKKSSIYWHATGYGKSPDKKPETQEHFGITTVEAMSAGTVPVVIDSAGQKESVQHSKNGFLWNELSEMVEYTKYLARNDKKLHSMSINAISASKKFNKEKFNHRIKEIMVEVEK